MEFFGAEMMASYGDAIRNLRWKQIFINEKVVDRTEFQFLTGIQIDYFRYSKLKNCLNGLVNKFYIPGMEPKELQIFFNEVKKGSRKYRNILSFTTLKRNYFASLPQVRTYKNVTGISTYSEIRARNNLNSWSNYSLPNRLKVFLFKFYGNILGTGNRVLHVNPNIDPSCFFCSINRVLPAPIETTQHVFYDCIIVKKIIDKFVSKYITIEITKEKYFSGCHSDNEKTNQSITLILDLLRYTIWQTKLSKKNISFYSIEDEITEILCGIISSNKKLKNNLLNCPFIISEGGDGAQQGQERDRHP